MRWTWPLIQLVLKNLDSQLVLFAEILVFESDSELSPQSHASYVVYNPPPLIREMTYVSAPLEHSGEGQF